MNKNMNSVDKKILIMDWKWKMGIKEVNRLVRRMVEKDSAFRAKGNLSGSKSGKGTEDRWTLGSLGGGGRSDSRAIRWEQAGGGKEWGRLFESQEYKWRSLKTCPFAL